MPTFYIAWANEGEAFGASHQVEALKVRSFRLAQQEGGFATLDVVVPNPKVGLIGPGRKKWVWFSMLDGVTVTALFKGRLVAAPLAFDGELVTLSFQARPSNFDAQKRTLAAALRVAPYYDAIWVAADRRDDPDAVLEFYPKAWHVDRVSHAVSASDFISGEGGSADFADNFLYASLNAAITATPLRAVNVEGRVTWDQAASGTVDLSATLKAAFAAAGSGNGWTITSLTGGGLSEDWPEKGDRIGSGWTVGDSAVTRVDNLVVEQGYVTVIAVNETGTIPVWTMLPVFEADYSVTRQRSEKLRFTLRADCQSIVTEPDDEDVSFISLASADADKAIDAGGLKPVRDVRRRSYFPTARGQQSLQALIAMARAQLLERARAVQVSVQLPFLNAVELDCTMNARFEDDRLPGGEASGKVIGYELALSGDDMALHATVTIGCIVGRGDTVVAAAGTGEYAEDGYAEDGWQVMVGEFVMPVAGEVRYSTSFVGTPANDDGVNFLSGMTPTANVEALVVSNGEAAQRAVLEGLGDVVEDLVQAAKALDEVYTEVDLELRPLEGGPFETTYNVTVSRLMVPKTIDLEAA